MSARAAITILRPRDEVERLWRDAQFHPEHVDRADAEVRFVDAPGDRGTEIHVTIRRRVIGGVIGEGVQKLLGRDPVAKIKDDLRHFKQLLETGVVARSEAAPEGESLERKLKPRPAQPLTAGERQKVGV